MWVLSLCIYWCSCWCCFLLNICCLYIDPWGEHTKNWMHINHCLSSAKAIPIQEVQQLPNVDAAASDAVKLCMWWLPSLVDIFWKLLFPNLWINSARLHQFTKQRFINKQTVEKEFFIHIYHQNLLQFGNVGQELSLLVIKLTTLRRKLTQQFITFENHSFSSSGLPFTCSQCTPVRCNDVMANGTRHQQKLQNFAEEFNRWYQLV